MKTEASRRARNATTLWRGGPGWMRAIGGAVSLALLVSVCAGADWKEVRQTLGRDGEIDEGVLRVSFPRTDLHVTKDGVPVSAELVLDSWYGFWPQPDGSTVLMGDTCCREDELDGVLHEIATQGLELTALHNHLIGETPRVLFVHLSGRGRAEDLARKAKSVLSRTHAPVKPEPEKEAKESARDWTRITAVLGEPGEREGDIIAYDFPRTERLTMTGQPMPSTDALETAPEVKFQMLADGRAITYGEMILTSAEVNPVFQALEQHGIGVTALHNHMIAEEPRLFFMHWWAVGDPGKLAGGVRAALGQAHVGKQSQP